MFVGFDLDRCMEAAGVLFSTTETKMLSRMRLLKYLYLANRKSLQETGDPIVDDDVYAMKDGPVLSQTYDLIKGSSLNESANAAWRSHFEIKDYIQIRMVRDPGSDHLSDYDVDVLKEIADRYKDMEDFELSEFTHGFDEWQRNWHKNLLRERISEYDLLSGVGFAPDEIKTVLDEAKVYAAERELLGCR
jgi:uncharacterized phage-associated protein